MKSVVIMSMIVITEVRLQNPIRILVARDRTKKSSLFGTSPAKPKQAMRTASKTETKMVRASLPYLLIIGLNAKVPTK